MTEVADLETMDRAALVAAWSDVFDAPVPKGLSRPLLRRFLAIEIQSRRHGRLPVRVRKGLAREATAPKTPAVRLGGRLVREWNGVTHVVEATETGYAWNERSYRSLSAIAREITGAHWSGPRFFGLKAGGRS